MCRNGLSCICRIRTALLAEYAGLPAEERAPYEQDSEVERLLGKRSTVEAPVVSRDKSALWGLSDDCMPIGVGVLHKYLKDLAGDSPVPGFTVIAEESRLSSLIFQPATHHVISEQHHRSILPKHLPPSCHLPSVPYCDC